VAEVWGGLVRCSEGIDVALDQETVWEAQRLASTLPRQQSGVDG
jgi:hypothetical protein